MLGKALNVIGTNQALSSGYNIAGVFSYLMKSQDVDLVPFEKSNAQMSYEQAMGQWQGTISAMEETLQAVTKNIINPTPESILKFIGDFRKTYPPQPTPEQYGYDPKQNPISTNSEPTESVLAQTSAIIKGPTAGATTPATAGAAQ
jgi:hypothetical protein